MKIETTPNFNSPHGYVESSLLALTYFKREGQKIWGDPTVVYEMILEHGVEFQGSFKPKRMMQRQRCFHNAWLAARRDPELLYVEGYATTGILPVHHAWNVDSEGRVIDFTWEPEKVGREDQSKWEYFGMAFDVFSLDSWWAAKPTAGVLYEILVDFSMDDVLSFLVEVSTPSGKELK